MKNFFKKIKKRNQLVEIIGFCAAAALIVIAAVFISSGGMAKIVRVVTTNTTPISQVASIFPCSWFGDCSTFSTTYGISASPTSITAGQAVTLSWAAYNGNNMGSHCNTALPIGGTVCDPDLGCSRQQDCWINPSASTGVSGASIQVGVPNANWPACPYSPLTNGCQIGSITVYPTVTTTYDFCSYYYMNFSVNGVYSLPCYTTTITVTPVPTTVATFVATPAAVPNSNTGATLSWSGTAGSNFTGCTLSGGQWSGGTAVSINSSKVTSALAVSTTYTLTCTDSTYGAIVRTATVTVGSPVTADITGPASISVGQSATLSFYADSATPPTQCQLNNYNDSAAFINTAGCSTAQAQSYNTGVFSIPGTYAYKFYYYQNGWVLVKTFNLVVNPVAPTPIISAGSTTVQPNATTTLAWSATNLATGQCTLTAPSGAALGTNFVSTSGASSSYYYSGFIVAGGYLYELGGYSGSSWVNTYWRTPVTTDLTNSVWTNLGTLPSAVPGSISDPFVVGNNVYIFGGYNSTSAAYVGTICTAPIATMNVPGNWTCPATLPAGATAALSHAYPVSIGDYLYRFGGYNGTTAVAAVARAPLSSPTTWTNFPNVLPTALMYPNPVVVGNYVYLLGGYSASASNPVNTIYRALITSDLTNPASWTSAGVLPVPIYIAGVSVDSSNLYLTGGYGTGGTQSSTTYKIPLSTLASGAAVAGSWNTAGSLPTGIYPTIPFLMENKIYFAGGWNSGTGYVNKFFYAPFNDGLPYTSTANLPWRTDSGNNSAATWPITANSTTYTLQCTNSAGTNSASVTINEPDLCTNAPFNGIQNPLPGGVTAVGTTCSCTVVGTVWNGSSCAVPVPVITSFVGPIRVRKGTTATLNYNVVNPPASCTVTGTNGFSATISPVSNILGTVNTNTITANTSFTLTCAAVSVTTSVGITPTTKEL